MFGFLIFYQAGQVTNHPDNTGNGRRGGCDLALDAIEKIADVIESGFNAIHHAPKLLDGLVDFLNDLHQIVEQPDGKTAHAQQDDGDDDVEYVAGFHATEYTVSMPDQQVSDLGLKLNYWFLTNRQQLRRWWVLVLIAIDLFILTAVVTQGLLLLFRFRDPGNVVNAIVQTTQDIGAVQASLVPAALVQASPVTTPHGLGRYDFSLKLENPNATWMSTVTIQFTGGAKEFSPVRVVLPPKTTRYAMALDVAAPSTGLPQAGATITNIAWQRLDAQAIAAIPKVTIKNAVQSQRVLIAGDGTQRVVTQVSGNVVNPGFLALSGLRIGVVLQRNGATVGVRSAILSTVPAESTTPFSVEWDTIISDATEVLAIPEVHPGVVQP